jgi:hypothetical protein
MIIAVYKSTPSESHADDPVVRILQAVGYFEQARRLRLMGATFDDTGTDCL